MGQSLFTFLSFHNGSHKILCNRYATIGILYIFVDFIPFRFYMKYVWKKCYKNFFLAPILFKQYQITSGCGTVHIFPRNSHRQNEALVNASTCKQTKSKQQVYYQENKMNK